MNTLTNAKNRWIGDKSFYKVVLSIAFPIILQQLITSLVNLLDNIMVGQTGTLPMSGVSVANQLILIFNLAVFGSVSAVAIFGAQYAGKQDTHGMRSCLQLKLIIETLLASFFVILFSLFDKNLISVFLNPDTNSAADIAQTLQYAKSYLSVMMIGFIPFSFSQCLSSSIRETGETRFPMIASLLAVFVNFCGNYILIFGHFGAPRLGATGAAVATVISRFFELALLSCIAGRNKDRFRFFHGLLKDFRIPRNLVKDVVIKGTPLMINEILFSIGIAVLMQCYSVRGIIALAAFNISNTVENLFFVFNIAMGDSISILVGQKLGAGKTEEAVETDRKMIFFTVVVSALLGVILFGCSRLFPQVYKVDPEIRTLASTLLKICSLCLPISAFYNASYFTLRCGGKTIITFLFDSAGLVAITVPVAYCLAHFTSMPIQQMCLIIHLIDIYKVILGYFLVNRRIWVNDLVADK